MQVKQPITEYMLNGGQLEALREIRAGLNQIESWRQFINQKAREAGLPVRSIRLHELGMARHDLDGIGFEHDRACEHLKAAHGVAA